MTVMLLSLFPRADQPTHGRAVAEHTLDGVRLHKLRTVVDDVGWNVVPAAAFGHSNVDVRRRHFGHVEPDVLRPRMLNEVLILEFVLPHVNNVPLAPGGVVKHHSVESTQ